MKYLIIFVSLLLCVSSFAQSSFRSSPFTSGFGMKGIHTYAGFGFADFTVLSPSTQFRMDKGVYAYLGGERDINDDGTSVVISFNFMTTEGQALYNYTTLGGTPYTDVDVPFDSNNYQLGLGVKQRLFPNSWLRPYVEGGGLFGYHELKYGSTPAISGGKLKDALTGFGYYGEGGFEIDFSENYGVKIGGRYQVTETRKFETLANQVLKFESFVFQLGFLLRF